MDPNGRSAWISTAGFGILTVNSGLAIYRSRGDAGAVVFVLGSYAALLLLFHCLSAFERAPPGSAARERLKRTVWALSTFVTAMFAWKVAALMPPPVAAVVWGLAVATSIGGFLAFFVYT
ncbi:hypothetical protein E2562_004748 [Oryza meyeriana var. granulata]|uniref:Uncharacterized protein n=1 Tax=Oryza meyeriana var. granulata TaxID=110450 RepID=A0A6G1DE96_9ORYZ|nr:hypothetical protein E2562_004748 [Oryza meyeriana var. granulata]